MIIERTNGGELFAALKLVRKASTYEEVRPHLRKIFAAVSRNQKILSFRQQNKPRKISRRQEQQWTALRLIVKRLNRLGADFKRRTKASSS
jgi:hypothetical protein